MLISTLVSFVAVANSLPVIDLVGKVDLNYHTDAWKLESISNFDEIDHFAAFQGIQYLLFLIIINNITDTKYLT